MDLQAVAENAESTQIATPERNQHTLPRVSAPTTDSPAVQQQVATGDANPTAEDSESTQVA